MRTKDARQLEPRPAHYRCRFPAEYAPANRIEHPRTAYLRESAVTPALDRWLAQVFDRSQVE